MLLLGMIFGVMYLKTMLIIIALASNNYAMVNNDWKIGNKQSNGDK